MTKDPEGCCAKALRLFLLPAAGGAKGSVKLLSWVLWIGHVFTVNPAGPGEQCGWSLSIRLNTQPSSLRPLFSLITSVVGDSIVLNIRFFNASMHSFSEATIPFIMKKLLSLQCHLPSSVECNDTFGQNSEWSKNDFNALENCWVARNVNFLPVALSLPTHQDVLADFYPLTHLSTCRSFNFGFIDNLTCFGTVTPFTIPMLSIQTCWASNC